MAPSLSLSLSLVPLITGLFIARICDLPLVRGLTPFRLPFVISEWYSKEKKKRKIGGMYSRFCIRGKERGERG